MKKLFTLSLCFMTFALFAQTSSFTFGGQQRTYILHLPPNFSASDTLPLVLNLHGLTQNGQLQRELSGFDTIADRERFIVVHPYGLNAQWNSSGSPFYSGTDDVGFLNALIDTINRDYHINLSRVYSTGMSNGGFMSYRLACELNHRIAAIASVTGCMTDSIRYYCNPVRPVPVLHFHGTNDPIVNYNGAATNLSVDESLEYWRTFNNCPGNYSTTPFPDIVPSDNTTVSKLEWSPCDNQTEVIHYKVLNGGHTWAGNTTNFIIGGNTNMDVKASEIIWEFFNRHSLNGTINSVKEADAEKLISVYPNPANNVVNVEWKEPDVNTVTISDLTGRVILSESISDKSSAPINILNLNSGIYVLSLKHRSGTINRRIAKQ